MEHEDLFLYPECVSLLNFKAIVRNYSMYKCHILIGFGSVCHNDVLNDIESGGQCGNCDTRL